MKVNYFLSAAAFALVVPNCASAATFLDRASFLATLGSSFTDTYDTALGYPDPGSSPITVQSDADMSAAVGQTKYHTTGFSNLNIRQVGPGHANYCAGCNGSFTLDFTGTSFGDANGVFGAGLDIDYNSANLPYTAFVTLGDGSSFNYAIAPGSSFLGFTSAAKVKSIAFGLPSGGTTMDGSFAIDNLTIGAMSAAVPEPATWMMTIAGVGLIGGQLRRRNRATLAFA